MANRKYLVEINGHTLTRQTDRVYTHVVCNVLADGTPVAWAWCGRLDLAQKKVREFTRDNAGVNMQIFTVPAIAGEEGGVK